MVVGILLDTGCSRTMVRKSLVPGEKLLKGKVVRDIMLYPLAEVELEVSGHANDHARSSPTL